MGISEEKTEIDTTTMETNTESKSELELKKRKLKMKKKLEKETEKANKRGVCYMSRIPPHMDHVKLRQLLSQFGNIHRIFLAPQGSAAPVTSKRPHASRDQAYSEGWVEFADKNVAKRVANMLNGEQIGGKKRSSFYYDLWNIKYLSKFKWDDLTEELAFKRATREQKLALEISSAKKERDFYMSKVDQSRAMNAIEERLKKKQKIQQDSKAKSKINRSISESKMFLRMVGRPLMAKLKETTGIVGLDVVPNAKEVLIGLYSKTLEEIKKVPENDGYRKAVESFTNHRLKACQEEQDWEAIEKRLQCGQVEELIEEARDELKLISLVLEWDPWSWPNAGEKVEIIEDDSPIPKHVPIHRPPPLPKEFRETFEALLAAQKDFPKDILKSSLGDQSGKDTPAAASSSESTSKP